MSNFSIQTKKEYSKIRGSGEKNNEGSNENNFSSEQLEQAKHVHEEKHFLNMNMFFPEEVWVRILSKLTAKTDVRNCTNASFFFRGLLKNIRELEIVLPTVFGLLANIYSDNDNKDKCFKETNRRCISWRIPPNKMPHRMSRFWKCRLVCKTWNRVIQDLHQNRDAGHFDMGQEFEKAKNSVLGMTWGTEDLKDIHKVQSFIHHFNVTHFDLVNQMSKKCPFVGRSLKVGTVYLPLRTCMYYANVLVLLEKWGREVWYFEFVYHNCYYGIDPQTMYHYLKKLVLCMPNLKTLCIRFSFSPNNRFISEDDLEDLEHDLEREPFPTLVKLEHFSSYEMPSLLFNHIYLQNRQLQIIHVTPKYPDINKNYKL